MITTTAAGVSRPMTFLAAGVPFAAGIYIGGGALVLILIIIVIVLMLR
jgi:hypothetical protein